MDKYEKIRDLLAELEFPVTNHVSGANSLLRYELLRQSRAENIGNGNAENPDRVISALNLAISGRITPILTGLHEFPVIWYKGDKQTAWGLFQGAGRTVTITGARAATGYGEHVTMEIATELAEHNVTVLTSGSYGIDGMATRATLAAGGKTLAVLASGLDRYYPSGHQALLERVSETPGCAVISPFMPGTPVNRSRFLDRGKLMAELSKIVVIVEAGPRSGALRVADHATEIGVAVGAVPGPITSAASTGANSLLDGTAFPVQSASAILDRLVYESAPPLAGRAVRS